MRIRPKCDVVWLGAGAGITMNPPADRNSTPERLFLGDVIQIDVEQFCRHGLRVIHLRATDSLPLLEDLLDRDAVRRQRDVTIGERDLQACGRTLDRAAASDHRRHQDTGRQPAGDLLAPPPAFDKQTDVLKHAKLLDESG